MSDMKANPVKNTELKEAMEALQKDSSLENSVRMLNEVVNAKLLIPVSMDRKPEFDRKTGELMVEKDTKISFELMKTEKGLLYYPVFTDGAELKKCDVDKDQQSMLVNFNDLAAMLLQPQNEIAGFVINPMGDNLRFTTEMVKAMKEDMKKQDAEREQE